LKLAKNRDFYSAKKKSLQSKIAAAEKKAHADVSKKLASFGETMGDNISVHFLLGNKREARSYSNSIYVEAPKALLADIESLESLKEESQKGDQEIQNQAGELLISITFDPKTDDEKLAKKVREWCQV